MKKPADNSAEKVLREAVLNPPTPEWFLLDIKYLGVTPCGALYASLPQASGEFGELGAQFGQQFPVLPNIPTYFALGELEHKIISQ